MLFWVVPSTDPSKCKLATADFWYWAHCIYENNCITTNGGHISILSSVLPSCPWTKWRVNVIVPFVNFPNICHHVLAITVFLHSSWCLGITMHKLVIFHWQPKYKVDVEVHSMLLLTGQCCHGYDRYFYITTISKSKNYYIKCLYTEVWWSLAKIVYLLIDCTFVGGQLFWLCVCRTYTTQLLFK